MDSSNYIPMENVYDSDAVWDRSQSASGALSTTPRPTSAASSQFLPPYLRSTQFMEDHFNHPGTAQESLSSFSSSEQASTSLLRPLPRQVAQRQEPTTASRVSSGNSGETSEQQASERESQGNRKRKARGQGGPDDRTCDEELLIMARQENKAKMKVLRTQHENLLIERELMRQRAERDGLGDTVNETITNALRLAAEQFDWGDQ